MARFPLDDRYELLLGGTWTDVTGYVYERDPVGISRGRSAEAQTADPSKMSLTLDNRDGRFSPRNPTGAYYGLLGRNTPIRASLPFGETYLAPGPGDADVASTPDTASLDITGDIDIRIEYTATNLGQLIDLAGKRVDAGDQRSWNLGIFGDRTPALFWNTTGTSSGELFAFPDAQVPAGGGRIALRVTMDVDDGAGNRVLTFYTADSIAGPWTQLGSPVTEAGTTSIFASTAPLEVGCCADAGGEPVRGRVHAFQLFDGIDGTAVAAPDFTVQTPGDGSFTGSAGLVWTMQGDAHLDDRRYRFHGEISSLPATWGRDGVDDYVKVAARGIARRLGQNAPPLRSAMTREFANAARRNIVAYWPMEDVAGSTQVASALPGVEPARIVGPLDLAAYDGWTASDPIPVMNGGAVQATVPPYAGTGEISLRAFVFAPTGSVAADTSLLRITATGAAAEWNVRIGPGGGSGGGALGVYMTDRDGNAVTGGTGGNDLGTMYGFGMFSLGFTIIDLELSNDGAGGVDWRLIVFDFTNTDTIRDSIPITDIAGNIAGYNTGSATGVTVGGGGGLGDVVVGHLAVADDLTAYAATSPAIAAHNGERPVDRVERLCGEEEIPFTVASHRGGSNVVTLGDQLSEPFLDLLGEAAASDLGILSEPRDFLGLAYRPRVSLYNQPAAVTLDWGAGQVAGDLVPVDDDRSTVNDVTVQRVAGSSVRVEQTTGPLSVQPPPAGVGRYEARVDLSLESDVQLADQAAWRLHLGTVDEARYPQLTVNLRAPGLTDADVEAILALDVGDRITLTGVPHATGDVGLHVVGYSERLRLMEHTLTFTCTAASPWQVGVVEQAGLDRVDTGGSELAAAAGSTDTTLVVASTLGPEWTTAAADLPMDVLVAGERCTVTAIADAVDDDFTRTESGGWGTDPDGRAWTAYGTAADFSVSSGTATMSIPSAGTAYVAALSLDAPAVDFEVTFGAPVDAVTGDSLYVQVIACFDQAAFTWYDLRVRFHTDDTVRVLLERRDGASFTILTSEVVVPQLVVHPATTFLARMRVQDGVIAGKVWRSALAEPTTWHIVAHDSTYSAGDIGVQAFAPAGNTNATPLAFTFGSVRTITPQDFTVTRSVNGVVKTQTAGADVRLVEPVYIAL